MPHHDPADAPAAFKSLADQLNIRELEVFVSVCELGSISAASRREGITQSATSQMLQRCETRLNMVLVDRATRPLRLTADGQEMFRRAKKLLSEVRQFVALRDFSSTSEPIHLRVGLVETLALPFVPELARVLGSRLRQLSVRIGSTDEQRSRFIERELDVIIMSDPLEDLENVETYLLLEEPFVLLLPKGHSVHDLDDLRQISEELPMIGFGYKSAARTNIDAQLRRLKISVRRTFEIDLPDAVIGMVSAGLGWAIITPLTLLRAIRDAGEFTIAPFPGPAFNRRLYLAAREAELGPLPGILADMSRQIIRDAYMPKIEIEVPWVRAAIKVP